MSSTSQEDHQKRERQVSSNSHTRTRQASAGSTLSGIFHSKKCHQPHRFTSDIRDYELLSDIGGIEDISYLYLARHVPTGEYVALKYTDLNLSPDYELIEELIRTVRNASQCNHRNILPYWTSFVENERLWNVTHPMRAGTFRSIMANHFCEGFSEAIVATVLKEVLKAIIYMHDNLMIHNDIRADNILLDVHGEIRITGLRQMLSLSEGGEHMESVFSLVGDNIEWAAPEVLAQNSNYNEKADIYSFGITALELALNRTPFDDWPPLKVLLSKLEYPCPAIQTNKVLSKDFYRMVGACIQKNPNKRPTARELAEHIFFKKARSAKYLETHIVRRIVDGYKHDPTATVSTNHDTSHGTQQDYESTEKSRTSGSALGHSQNGISGDLAEEEEGIQVESEADVYYEHI